jgi:hypothetical protein
MPVRIADGDPAKSKELVLLDPTTLIQEQQMHRPILAH